MIIRYLDPEGEGVTWLWCLSCTYGCPSNSGEERLSKHMSVGVLGSSSRRWALGIGSLCLTTLAIRLRFYSWEQKASPRINAYRKSSISHV